MTLRVAFSCLVFLLSLISFASMATSEQCQCLLRVKTGDRKNAGTNTTVSLTLMPSYKSRLVIKSLEDWGIMARGHHYFQRDNLDIFSGKGPCLDVCAVTVESSGLGLNPGWYLDYVEVNIFKNITFPVNRWLDIYTPKAPSSLCRRQLMLPLQ